MAWRLFVVLALAAPPSQAAEIYVAAPEQRSGPYEEALQGLCDELHSCPPFLAPDAVLPDDARVVVALGGRAARRRLPARAVLVTALTPGFEARRDRAEGPVVRVALTLSPGDFGRKLKRLRPGVRRMALLWTASASERFVNAARAAAATMGLELFPVRVEDAARLPSLLRSLPAMDALWMAPDPELVTPGAYEAVAEAARGRGIVFYSPAPGLTKDGADASLAPSFRLEGARAGAVARAALTAPPPAADEYPVEGFPDPLSSMTVSTRPAPSNP